MDTPTMWGHAVIVALIVALRFVFKRDIRRIVVEFKNGESKEVKE